MSRVARRNGVDVTLGQGKLLVVAMAAMAALAACARDIELKHQLSGNGGHVSPTPPNVPHMPPGTFDQARAQGELRQAQAARLAGDPQGARRAAESAVADWPGDAAAWEELAADCRAGADEVGARYADFFAAKIDFVSTLPPRVAVLGFATLAAGTVGTHTGDYVYDQRTLDTAQRIASFYDERDAVAAFRIPPKAEAKP
jgi:hypothetical protein